VPRHELDPLALIAGVALGGLGVVVLVGQAAGLAARWTWPVLLILVGVVGLLVSRRGTGR
jgi:uncharacterized membrane protein (Fun14 family)